MEKAVFFLVCAVTDAPVCLGVCFLHTIKFFITETGAGAGALGRGEGSPAVSNNWQTADSSP